MKKAEQSEATRTALLQAARELFTEHGYADTGTEDIAQRAGVTRGAIYSSSVTRPASFMRLWKTSISLLCKQL